MNKSYNNLVTLLLIWVYYFIRFNLMFTDRKLQERLQTSYKLNSLFHI